MRLNLVVILIMNNIEPIWNKLKSVNIFGTKFNRNPWSIFENKTRTRMNILYITDPHGSARHLKASTHHASRSMTWGLPVDWLFSSVFTDKGREVQARRSHSTSEDAAEWGHQGQGDCFNGEVSQCSGWYECVLCPEFTFEYTWWTDGLDWK
jgi:hypothetical protein